MDDEADDRARRVELARVAGGVAHLAQHRLVEVRHGVDVVRGGEVDLVDLVDDVAEEVPGEHPVVGLLEHGGQHVAGVVAAGARQLSEVREEFAVDEIQESLAGSTVGLGGPVPPPIRSFDGRPEVPIGDLTVLLQPVEGLQEQQPGKLWDSVEVAVEPCVLAHRVPCRLDDGSQVSLR